MCSTANDDSLLSCMVCDAKREARIPSFGIGVDPAGMSEEALAELHYKIGLAAVNEGRMEYAFGLFLDSASTGYPPAENEVGSCLYSDKGTERDLERAFEYFSMSAAKGWLQSIAFSS